MSGRVHARLADEAIGPLFAQLLDDGKSIAKAEIGLARAGVRLRVARAKAGLILAAIAFAILHLTLIAGFVMLALALANVVGPLVAGLVVIAAGAAIAGLFARAAVGRIRLGFGPLPAGDAS